MNAASKEPRDAAEQPVSTNGTSRASETSDESIAQESPAPIRLGLWRAERDAYGFIDAVLDRLPERYTVHEFHTFRGAIEDQARADLDQVDLVWYEWAERRKLHLSEFVSSTPMLCRVHPTVAYDRTPKEVRWPDVDQWVFPAVGLQRAFQKNHRGSITGTVLPTGVDVDRIPIDTSQEPTKNIALFGPIHPEDNVVLLFQIMEALVEEDDAFHLHIVGAAKDEAIVPYLKRQVEQRGLEDHIHFYGVITEEERGRWLNQCTYVLSTRPLERDWTGLMEAMARGLKPVIHRYPGAEQGFAPDMLFDTVDEAVGMIANETYEPARYRAFIEDRYHLDSVATNFVRLLDRLASEAYPERMAQLFTRERAERVQNGDAKPADELLDDIRQHLEEGDRAAAGACIEQLNFEALDEPDKLEARVLAVELALEQERFTDALFHADAAMDLAPDEPMVVHLAGQALWLQGNPQAGAEALVRSAELLAHVEESGEEVRFAMDEAEAYLVAGEICEQFEQYTAARTFLERANQHDPDSEEVAEVLDRVNEAALKQLS